MRARCTSTATTLRARLASLAFAAFSAAAGAGGGACAPDPGPASMPVDEEVAAREVNPEGIAYPTDNIGRAARSGNAPGSRIPNFAFRGYLDSNKAAGLSVISLSDYYDPAGARYKLIHLMAAATWCSVCQGQSRDMARTYDALRAEGLVSIQVLVQGPNPGAGPTLADLDGWIDRHETRFSVAVDSNAKKLSQVATLTAVPWNALIDARTMEIVRAGVGAPADFAEYARRGLAIARAPAGASF